ncbi:Osmolarity sensory histidine kinase EnvZ [Burkholderia diffusa]|nr:Osmolarity sensory histidine kinase EnvZ [Burkholderia diffusa]
MSGSGLGLAIVKRVAAQQGATVTLGDAAAGGLLVSVVFRDAEMPAQVPQASESV